MVNFFNYIKNAGTMAKAHPTTFWARPWTQEAADAGRVLVDARSKAGHVWAGVRGAALAPFSVVGAMASIPVRGTHAAWNFKTTGGHRPGRWGLIAAGAIPATIAGASILRGAFGKEPGDKNLPPELQDTIAKQEALQQQQMATQQVLSDMQASLSATQTAPEAPAAVTAANNNNPSTRLSAGHMAELQGMAAAQGQQMVRA